jgi:periplasmic copper chaperone A
VTRRRFAAAALGLAAGLAAVTGCGSSHGGHAANSPHADGKAGAGAGRPELTVLHPYIPAPAASDLAAGYLTIRNDGTAADRLVKVVSSITRDVTLHRTTPTTMREVTSFPIPAGGTLTLGRGGNHLMLNGLAHRPAVGQTVTFRLSFATSAPITVKVPVKPMTYRPPTGP